MTLKSTHLCAAGLAFAILGLAAAASAQVAPVVFDEFRDAVPGKFFSTAGTHTNPESPNTLNVGLESGEGAFRACAPASIPFSPLPCNNTRVAMDTIAFVVRPPDGYYVSSITIAQAGTGLIQRLADARGSSWWVVAGVPIDLDGPFGGAAQFPIGGRAWSRSRTLELSDSSVRAIPISLTTALFAYAPGTSGAARVELTSATVAVTVAPIGPAAKKTATFDIKGFAGTFDGDFHGATGTATGPDGENLSHLLVFDPLAGFKDAPGGTVNWSFPADATYNGASGTAAIIINPADATIAVTGFSGTYDGFPHRATGTATGISGILGDLNQHLDLGASFTNVPGGTATWTFGGDPNYNAATGTVAITINKAASVLTWPAPAAITAGTALSGTQLNATANVAGSTATVAGTFVYNPPAGTVLAAGTHSLTVAFTPTDAVNYSGSTATVSILVNPAAGGSNLRIENPGPQTNRVGDDVRLQIEVSGDNDGRHGGRLRGTYGATGLPPGLRIERDGEIRGRPTTVGTYRVVVSFTQRLDGATVTTAFDWTVLPGPPKGKTK